MSKKLQVVVMTLSAAAVGAVVGLFCMPMIDFLFSTENADLASGIAHVVNTMITGVVLGGLLGFFVGLWTIGAFDSKERRYQLEPPESCLRCYAEIPAEQTVCPQCGWSWESDHSAE